MRTAAEQLLLEKARRGERILPADTCATITTEVELEQYRLALRAAGGLTDEAQQAVARRRVELQRAKGVRGSERP